MKILNRFNSEIIFQNDSNCMKETVEAALAAGVSLSYANLSGASLIYADLSGASLSGANLN